MKKENTTVKLKLIDRIMLPSVLKAQGDYKTLVINDGLKKKVAITETELLDIKSINNGDAVSIDPLAAKKEFEYQFTELERSELVSCLKEMDASKKLTESHLGLYAAFVL